MLANACQVGMKREMSVRVRPVEEPSSMAADNQAAAPPSKAAWAANAGDIAATAGSGSSQPVHRGGFASSSLPSGWRSSFNKKQGLYSSAVSRLNTQRVQHALSMEAEPRGRRRSSAATYPDMIHEIGDEHDSKEAEGSDTSGLSRRLLDPGPVSLFSNVRTSFAKDSEESKDTVTCMTIRAMGLVDPHRPYYILWDVLIRVCIIYISVMVPYEVAFGVFSKPEQYLTSWQFYLNRIVDGIYLVDIYLSFFTMYFDKQRQMWVTNRKDIRNNYRRTWFLLDVVTLVPFDALVIFGPWANFGALLKFLRFGKLLSKWGDSPLADRMEESFAVDYSMLEIAKYLGFLFLITHWVACGFGVLLIASPDFNWARPYLDALESDHDNYVPPAEEALDADDACDSPNLYGRSFDCYPPVRLYLSSLYWSAMTVTTIGYGDIVPTSMLEQAVVVMAMLLGGVVFGYIVGVFAGIISNQDQQQKRYREEMRDLNALVKEAHLPTHQAKDLRSFFKFIHVSRASSMSAYQHLLSRMSPQLRGQVTRLTDNNWIERLPHFRNCPEAFVVELVQALGYQAFPPGETIFKYGDENKQMYVIKKGVVFFAGRVLLPGNTMCEESLYKPGLQGRSALTLAYTYLYTLSPEAAYHVVRGYPEVERQFRVLSIKRLFREEVCSYAYAVQALFDEGLLMPVEETKAPNRFHQENETLRHLGFMPGDKERGPRDSKKDKTPYIHPLWGHLNAMRVDHYYKKLRMIIRVTEEEAHRLDRSVEVIQRWVRGWLARRDVHSLKLRRREESRERLLASMPALVSRMQQKLDELSATVMLARPVDPGLALAHLPSMHREPPSSHGLQYQQIVEDKLSSLEGQLGWQQMTLASIAESLKMVSSMMSVSQVVPEIPEDSLINHEKHAADTGTEHSEDPVSALEGLLPPAGFQPPQGAPPE